MLTFIYYIIGFTSVLNINILRVHSITTKMSQSQPVIPVTMQYGGGHALGHELHHIERDVHRTGDHIQREINNAERNTIATINALANADQAQTRSSQIESRQAIERNADQLASEGNRNADFTNAGVNRNSDFTNASVNRNADYTNAAIQSTSTQGLLATENTSTATQLGVQNTSSAIQSSIAASNSQAERIAGETRNILNTQIQLMLLDSKTNALQLASSLSLSTGKILAQGSATQLQASDYTKDIQLLAQQNFQATQLAQAKDTASLQLQAAQYNKSAELQAATYFGKLEVSALTNTAKIMEKLCECCCETKQNFAATQAIIMQNGTNNQASIQQGQMNQLTQALAAAQQEALVARITNSVINTTTTVSGGGSGGGGGGGRP